ncbi:MAG TPA: hypothetical protein VEL74_24420, partial [Thermoanaerobaculia bacterium]|nr:hypothetical protein [Thermoanaerobaculia bacterium]
SEPAAAPRPVPVPSSAAAVPAVDTVGGPFRKMTVEQSVGVPWSQRLVPPLLGAGLALLLAATLLSSPVSLLLPFPWQDRERALVTETQRASLYLKVDRAAKTHFLLEGSFPDQLSRLAGLGLLSSQDLRDSQGRLLQYTPGEESYTLQPLANGAPVAGEGATEAITGNFLLDPEFLKMAPQTKGQPLILLD